MISLSPAEIATATHGTLSGVVDVNSPRVTGVTVDSRDVEAGDLFVAIAGDRVDGHDFAEGAIAAGAVCVLSARPLQAADGSALPCVVVDDPVLAL